MDEPAVGAETAAKELLEVKHDPSSELEATESELPDGSDGEDLVYSYIKETLQVESKNESAVPPLPSNDLSSLPTADSPPREDLGSDGDDNEVEPARPRKRKRLISKEDERKLLRNTGQAYVTSRGRPVEGKHFVNEPCSCRKKCSQLITEDERRAMFKQFWDIASLDAQNVYVGSLIEQEKLSRAGKRYSKFPKLVNNLYHLHVGSERVATVCQKYFLATFQISESRMRKAVKRRLMGIDQVRKRVPGNKTEEKRVEIVRKHMASFPSYESPYTKADDPDRKYLSPQLNLVLMHRLYNEYCKENKIKPVGFNVYRKVFARDVKLSFGTPKRDPCVTCEQFEISMDANDDPVQQVLLQSAQDLHLWRAEFAQSAMKADQEASEVDSAVYAFTFDLQRALPFPVLTCSLAYYKRSMHLYNCGCHELSSGTGVMYTWDETVASNGVQEISSCVAKHVRKYASMFKRVIMYSNSCSEQNRNIKMALAIMRILQEPNDIESIDHKFMLPGHSYLPNESDFEYVEQSGKRKLRYNPSDWYDAMRDARRHKPFEVHQMVRRDFRGTKALESLVTNFTKNEANGPVSWPGIQWLRYLRAEPFKISYKETLQEDVPFRCINLRPVDAGSAAKAVSFIDVVQEKLYARPRHVSIERKKDLEDLLSYIPAASHDFFTALKTRANLKEIGHLQAVEDNSKAVKTEQEWFC